MWTHDGTRSAGMLMELMIEKLHEVVSKDPRGTRVCRAR